MENENETTDKTAAPFPKAGAMAQEARLATGVEAAKLCADLRISTAALEALEACQYDRLPGDPYVRALLGSIARYLRLDPQKLVQAYNAELGAAAAAPPVTPYKDLSQTHVMAHKQIFVLLLVVLLFALLLLLSRLNTSDENPGTKSGLSDTPATVTPPPDTLPESRSLLPEAAMDTSATSGPASPAPVDTASRTTADSASRPAATARATPAPPPPAVASTPSRVLVKPLVDSVWIRVQRSGKPETVELLLLGKQLEVTHSDTIGLILGKKKSVELAFAETTLIPVKKRFRIVGKQLRYY